MIRAAIACGCAADMPVYPAELSTLAAMQQEGAARG